MKKELDLLLRKIRKIDLSKLLKKDWLLKGISLVLAVVLWYFVGGEDRVDKNVMIPIEIINLPRDLVISNQFKKEIEVTVSGPRSLILEMSSRAITRQVDLSSATPGTMVIENDNDHIPVPRGITVQRVQPSSIILSLDKLIQKQFPISARTVGEVADGYFIKALKMDPEVITITGPLTILSQFDELYTRAINLSGVQKSIQLQVPLVLEPAIVELIGETSVTADLTVAPEMVTLTFDSLLMEVEVDGKKRKVSPELVQITANIPLLLLPEDADPKDLLMVKAVEQKGEKALVVKVVPRVDVALPIEIVSIVPSKVVLVDETLFPLYKIMPGAAEAGEDSGTRTEAAPQPTVIEPQSAEQAEFDGDDDSGVQVIKLDKSKTKHIE